MSPTKKELEQFATENRATASIEYALVCSLIAVVCVSVVLLVGGNTTALYNKVCNAVSTAVAGRLDC